MDKLKKCGQEWIKFDKNNEPEYGFMVDGTKIKKFVPLSDKKITRIILPQICEEKALTPEQIKFAVDNIDYNKDATLASLNREMLKSYVCGQMKIATGCFEGRFKKSDEPIEIVVPFNHSLMIDHSAFDSDIKHKFILNEGMEIFKINRMFDTWFDYEHEFWALIGRKEIKDINFNDFREAYGVSKFEPSESYNFEVAYLNKKPKDTTKGKEK